MDKDGGRCKGFSQLLKGGTTGVGESPQDTFASEVSQRNDYIGVIKNEAMIKVCKAKEGLYVLDLPRLGPI